MQTTLSDPRRIEIIDVLRGFALLGIILVHMVEQYYAGQWPEEISKQYPPSIPDNIIQGVVAILITGKFYMIFSFLFGLSFFIQSSKKQDDPNFLKRFAWRLLLLFMIGMIHHIHYRGDILTIYALLGFPLLLFYRASDKILLIVSLVLILNIPSVLVRVGYGLFNPQENPFEFQDQVSLMNYYKAVKYGAYSEILTQNLNSFGLKMLFQLISGRIFITFGLFLLGVYAGRKQFFSDLPTSTPLIKRLLGYSWKILLGLVVVMAIIFGGAALLKVNLPQFVQFAVGGFAYDLFNACIAVVYTGAVLLWFQRSRGRTIFLNFYDVGRMGLTVYLTQSIVGFLIFFSPGLGLLAEHGAMIWFGAGVVLFLIQILFAKFWFQRFYFGFFEWLWRSATYMTVQPLVKQKTFSLKL
jgi:uncharacterized protein